MQYFITIFCKVNERKDKDTPEIREVLYLYTVHQLFEGIQILHENKELFAVYKAEQVLDFS